MTSGPELLDVATRLADRAAPGEQVEAFVARSTSTTVRAYGGDVESLTQASTAGVGVRVIVDGREGFAYAGTLDEGVVLDALAEARDNAEFAQPDEHNGLAEPDGVTAPDLDVWRPGMVDVPTPDKVAMALELERATLGRDPRVTGVRTAVFSDGRSEGAVATSTGIRAWGRHSTCYLMVQALATQDGETQIEAGLSVGRELADLDVEEAADDAVLRSTRLLGSTKPTTQRVALVLEPRMAATVLGIVGGMLNGSAVIKGRSPFGDRVGEQIASPLLTFVDDPTDIRSLGAEAYDGEGLAHRRNELVVDGVLRGFLHNSYTGRRAGAASTGSARRGFSSTPDVGAQAIVVTPGAGTHEELLADVDLGVLVTSMAGLHSGVNPVSGDFSVGVDGLMVREGALAEPIREATVASTVQRLLLDIAAVGADLEWLPDGTGGVTLVIPDVALSGS
ncbi:MAG TPA: TldD/PmbA family protein [Acidimicrobiales bacterium]|nr:TldD/PmbA family protein [Acidimicrobiales bacterium]